MADSQHVIDVDESSFQHEVIERSSQVPVVVDFWAPWCGPCRVLSPVLVNLAQEYDGRFVLAKLNVDENPQLSAQFGVQGIPLVKAFRDGRVVDEFVGAQPHPTVRQFIERLVPDPLEMQIGAARALLAQDKWGEAEALYRQVLAADAERPTALVGLATALLRQGEADAAAETLARVPTDTPAASEVERLRREIALRAEAGKMDEAALRARLEEAPADLDARYALASLLTVEGRYQDALDDYLEIIRRNRTYRNGAARQAMLDIFDVLQDELLVRNYRNKLAMVLFI